MSRGRVILILGSMMSSKSSMLLGYVERAQYASKSVVLVRPSTDTREYVSRKRVTPKCPIVTCNRLLDIKDELLKYDVICVDEAQFISHIGADSNSFALNDKKVVLAALAGDSDRNPWANVSELLPYVDDVVKTNAVCCYCGADNVGTFTFYEGTKTQQIVIGDETDKYRAACRDCYREKSVLTHQ